MRPGIALALVLMTVALAGCGSALDAPGEGTFPAWQAVAQANICQISREAPGASIPRLMEGVLNAPPPTDRRPQVVALRDAAIALRNGGAPLSADEQRRRGDEVRVSLGVLGLYLPGTPGAPC